MKKRIIKNGWKWKASDSSQVHHSTLSSNCWQVCMTLYSSFSPILLEVRLWFHPIHVPRTMLDCGLPFPSTDDCTEQHDKDFEQIGMRRSAHSAPWEGMPQSPQTAEASTRNTGAGAAGAAGELQINKWLIYGNKTWDVTETSSFTQAARGTKFHGAPLAAEQFLSPPLS